MLLLRPTSVILYCFDDNVQWFFVCCIFSLIPSLYSSLKSEGHSFVNDDMVRLIFICLDTLLTKTVAGFCGTSGHCVDGIW